MARSIFGWSLPPGVTHRMIDEAMGMDQPCEMCGRDPDACICPECPVCDTYGDPLCYHKHGLVVTKEQIDSLTEFILFEADEIKNAREHEEALYQQWKEDKKPME